MARILDIADAVAAELNAHEFGTEFTALRAYLPRFDLEAMGTLHVTVVPNALEMSLSTRGGGDRDYVVDVGVQKRFAQGESDEVDGLMDLVEGVALHFEGLALEDQGVTCIGVKNAPVYVQEHMAELRQFTSVVSLTFRDGG